MVYFTIISGHRDIKKNIVQQIYLHRWTVYQLICIEGSIFVWKNVYLIRPLTCWMTNCDSTNPSISTHSLMVHSRCFWVQYGSSCCRCDALLAVVMSDTCSIVQCRTISVELCISKEFNLTLYCIAMSVERLSDTEFV